MTNPPGAMPPLPEPEGWLYDWTHSSALGNPDEEFTSFTTDEAYAKGHRNARPVYAAPLIARVAELQADAARYRYLRNAPAEVPAAGVEVAYWEACAGESIRGEKLDAEIDAALTPTKD